LIILFVLIHALVLLPYGSPGNAAFAQERPPINTAILDAEIVGGQAADPGEYPWQAMLLDQDGRFACGGTLIDPQWILTASHCTDGTTITTIVLGAHQRTATAESSRQTIPVDQIIRHPAYNNSTFDNDIALIHLSRPAQLNQRVALIAPIAADQAALVSAGTVAIVTGWGTTSEGGSLATALQEVAVPLVSHSLCSAAYANDLSVNMLCAGLRAGGKDSCQGDSGGPLIVPDSTTPAGWQVAGIVSWGNGCARAGYYGVYTNVINYTGWISQQLKASVPDPAPTAPAPDGAINNGDFEAGNSGGWMQNSTQGYPLIVETLPLPALSGRYAAWLGGADSERSRLTQALLLPNPEQLYLVFAQQIQSDEGRCGSDSAKIFLNGKRLLTRDLCQATATTTWENIVIDITRYAGQRSNIQFYVNTDVHAPSSWLIDNVYITAAPDSAAIDQILAPEDIADPLAAENEAPQEEGASDTVEETIEEELVVEAPEEAPAADDVEPSQPLYLPIVQH
jgi:hypothetical protein